MPSSRLPNDVEGVLSKPNLHVLGWKGRWTEAALLFGVPHVQGKGEDAHETEIIIAGNVKKVSPRAKEDQREDRKRRNWIKNSFLFIRKSEIEINYNFTKKLKWTKKLWLGDKTIEPNEKKTYEGELFSQIWAD